VIDRDNFPQFDLAAFRRGVDHLLRHSDGGATAHLHRRAERGAPSARPGRARRLRAAIRAVGGERLVEDHEFLENYKRIVHLIGRTFRDTGIEVLLHNLANPAKSICAIDGGVVTGRALEMGTTSLVIDLKKRRLLNQDKLNYELVIGARRFKCTTIPIYRREFGLVAALCINIDVNYVRDHVRASPERIDEFLRQYVLTEMVLEENILSREEYVQAVHGKRHWLDSARLAGRPA
jgi:predicted transcriptional regulator YheO